MLTVNELFALVLFQIHIVLILKYFVMISQRPTGRYQENEMYKPSHGYTAVGIEGWCARGGRQLAVGTMPTFYCSLMKMTRTFVVDDVREGGDPIAQGYAVMVSPGQAARS